MPRTHSSVGHDGEDDGDADEGSLECNKRRAYALDQLVAATRFPTITDEGRLKVFVICYLRYDKTCWCATTCYFEAAGFVCLQFE